METKKLIGIILYNLDLFYRRLQESLKEEGIFKKLELKNKIDLRNRINELKEYRIAYLKVFENIFLAKPKPKDNDQVSLKNKKEVINKGEIRLLKNVLYLVNYWRRTTYFNFLYREFSKERLYEEIQHYKQWLWFYLKCYSILTKK